ncbi:MAG TPA: ABC transporter ATP-binding protein [Planctomycetota bacterium]|nr:ABC transporter ATP-binding protein [Planctomycetota bacterium]
MSGAAVVPNTALAVECSGVTKSFGEGSARVQALRGVDLEVRSGELMLLVGPSGCGKTTLISVIAGILDQDGGDCRVFGESVLGMGAREKIEFRARNVGFVFQAFHLLPSLTAAENVSVPLLLNGVPRNEALARAKEILALVGLGDRTAAYSSQLSGGQQQRVAIARAIVHEPRLIVCDEPTSALDGATGISVMELLRSKALRHDRALVIVTHDSRIFSFADRVAQMNDGRILEVGEPALAKA